MVNFRELQPGDEAYIVANLCQGERMTIADTGANAETAVAIAVQFSSVVRVAVTDAGTPLAVFGVQPVPLPDLNWGALWFLSTDEAFKHPRVMLREGKRFVREMLETYDQLIDVVDMRHVGVPTWLRHLGFVPVDKTTYNGVEMCLYSTKRQNGH